MAVAPERVERSDAAGSQNSVGGADGFAAHLGPLFASALLERPELYVVHFDADWVILGANHTLRLAAGGEPSLDGRCFLDLVDENSAALLERTEAGGKLDGGAATVQHPIPAGARTVEYAFRAVEDGWTGIGRDRTEEFELVSQMATLVEDLESAIGKERALARQLRDLADRDALTGLFNRRQLEERLQEHTREYVELGVPFAVICLDLDHFKRVNDTHGHSVGDQALRCLASAIQGTVRERDTAARYGGEEFVVVVSRAEQPQVLAIAERLRGAVENAALPASLDRLTVSVGVACTKPSDLSRAARLFDLADAALYQAKAEGRNRVCMAD